MADLVIYDSSRWVTVAAAAVALNSVPNATIYDAKNKTLANLTSWISGLGSAAYDKIYSCINDTRIEEVLGTAVLTITGVAANEIAWCKVDEGGDAVPLGSYVSGNASVTADAVLLKTSINAGTTYHGYTADSVAGVVTITAPVGSGVGANAYQMKVDSDSAATIALTVTTDFAVTDTGVSAVGSLGDLSEAYFIDLETKVSAAPYDTGTATAGANTTITLEVGSSAVNDVFNGMYLLTTGGTGPDQVRRITDYVGSSRVATIDYAWTVNAANGTTYTITDDLLSFGRTYLLKGAAWVAWENIYGSVTPPLAIGYITDYIYPYKAAADYTGTAQASSSSTIKLAAGASATDDIFNDFYVGVVSGTGKGQYRLITDYDGGTKVADVAYDWVVTPSTDSVYVMMTLENLMFADKYVENYITAYLYNLSDGNVTSNWHKLLDLGQVDTDFNPVNTSAVSSPQDLKFLFNTVFPEGKAIYYNSLR